MPTKPQDGLRDWVRDLVDLTPSLEDAIAMYDRGGLGDPDSSAQGVLMDVARRVANAPKHADQIPEHVMVTMTKPLNTTLDDAISIVEELMVLGMEYLGITEDT